MCVDKIQINSRLFLKHRFFAYVITEKISNCTFATRWSSEYNGSSSWIYVGVPIFTGNIILIGKISFSVREQRIKFTNLSVKRYIVVLESNKKKVELIFSTRAAPAFQLVAFHKRLWKIYLWSINYGYIHKTWA